jgi:hypothetical protein
VYNNIKCLKKPMSICWHKEASNPSIEGMPKRLRLLCTPHVQRSTSHCSALE